MSATTRHVTIRSIFSWGRLPIMHAIWSYAIKQGWEYDKSAKYADADDAIADAVANSDLSDIEADMLAEFDAIPVGYFNDEDDHAEEPESDIEMARRLR